MVEKLWDSPEIYSIHVTLPNSPLRWLNSYVIKTPEATLIIDTGFNLDCCRQDLWNGIRELDLDESKLALFVTHFHTDHMGLVGDFIDRNIPVYMGREEHAFTMRVRFGGGPASLEETFRLEGFASEDLALRKDASKDGRHEIRKPFEVIPVDDGDVLMVGNVKVQCIATPGHTPGHICLYLPEEQLFFSGDHVLFDISPNISIWNGVPHSLQDYIQNLQKVRSLPVKAVFPAHRTGRQDMAARIDELIDHHGWRLDEIYQCVKQNPGFTAFEIAGHITWSARGLGWDQFPPQQKWFAVSETLAHLYYLVDKGQVTRTPNGDVFTYYCANLPSE